MANCCKYEIRVRGSKKACLMVYESMPSMDNKDLDWERKDGNSHLLSFTGDTKWSVNYDVKDALGRLDVDAMSESEIERKGVDFWGYSLRAKSEAFQCEIMVHYWSGESGFDQFDHYKDGKILKQRKIEYNYDEPNKFDWDKLEFVGHEGEYDESVDGEANDVAFMSKMMNFFGGNTESGEPEISEEDQKELDDVLDKMENLLDKMKAKARESGIDVDNAPIGDTDYDMYNWTFTEGKRQSANGWSIAIPDGFKVIDSKEGRPFEAVPCEMKTDDDSISVQILPGEGLSSSLPKEWWKYHPYARSGMVEIIGVNMAEKLAQSGFSPEIMSTAFSDICANVMIQDAMGQAQIYQAMVLTDTKIQQLRVQTGFITSEQKKRLNKSVIAWLETFMFDKPNSFMPKESPLESESVFNDLKSGKTKSFNEAVDSADNEFWAAVNGRLGTINYLSENGLLGKDIADTVREILKHGVEVMEFYYLKADQLIEKLKEQQLNPGIMAKVYKKLDDLKEEVPEITVDDEKITVSLSAKIVEIQKKWKAEVNETAKAEQVRKEEEKRRREAERARKEEEKKRQEAARKEKLDKYNAAHKAWEDECSRIKASRSGIIESEISLKKKKLVDEITEERDKAVAKAEATMKEQNERKTVAEATLATLGVFKFSQKKAQRLIIEEAKQAIERAQREIEVAKYGYSSKMNRVNRDAESSRQSIQELVEKKMPLPAEPKKPF